MDASEERGWFSKVSAGHMALAAMSLICIAILFFITAAIKPIAKEVESAQLQEVPTRKALFTFAPIVLREPEARILFVGDMFFDRQIRFIQSQSGMDFPFSCIDPLLFSADTVVGNMEGPITEHASVSFGSVVGSPNNYRFTFPTSTAEMLLRHNISIVSIGNNHILNFGYTGLQSTHSYLQKAGVGYFGGVVGEEPVYRTSINNVPLSFVAYNEFGGSKPAIVADMIQSEKESGRVVVVFSHWGEEYSKDANTLRPIANLFSKSGASAIIGAHPHVVGEYEKIASTTVYYSLGNFIFDQYFSQDVRQGLAVMLTFSSNGVVENAQEYPLVIGRDGRTCLRQ